jgi:hypothetical protein
MADSLFFDGIDDVIIAPIGGGAFAFGPGTICAIVKLNFDSGAHTSPLTAGTSDGARYGLYRDPSELMDLVLDGTEATSTTGITVAQGWQLLAWTKATGSVAPQSYRYVYDTTTWTRVASGTSQANSSTPATQFQIGGGNSASFWDGNILIAGVWNTVLSQATIDTLIIGYQDWIDAAPVEAWRLDSMSALQSFGTTGTADESSRTGTTLDTGDVPAGWDDTLGGLTPPYVSISVA